MWKWKIFSKYYGWFSDYFDEVIDAEAKSNEEKTKTVQTNFNEKSMTCKTKNFCTLLAVLLIDIAVLIAVSIYCYLIKNKTKQKHMLPFHNTNNELKQVLYL